MSKLHNINFHNLSIRQYIVFIALTIIGVLLSLPDNNILNSLAPLLFLGAVILIVITIFTSKNSSDDKPSQNDSKK